MNKTSLVKKVLTLVIVSDVKRDSASLLLSGMNK